MLNRLRLVTLLDILKNQKTHNFDYLKKKLFINDDFELQSIIFDAINQNLFSGKIDLYNKILKVKNSII